MKILEAATKVNKLNTSRIDWLKDVLGDLNLLMTLDDEESKFIIAMAKDVKKYIEYLESKSKGE